MTLIIPTKADITAPCADGPIIARLKLAGVPLDLHYADFVDDPKCFAVRGYRVGCYADTGETAWVRYAIDTACAAVDTGAGVRLEGYNQIGKSHLAAAMCRRSLVDCFWINEADFAAFVYASKKPNSTAPTVDDLIHYLLAPVNSGWRRGAIGRVVYDDAGAKADYGGAGVVWIGELFRLLEAILNAGIALTVTTNVDSDTLAQEPEYGGLGPRVGLRLVRMSGEACLLYAPLKEKATAPKSPPPRRGRCTCPEHYLAYPPSTPEKECIALEMPDGSIRNVVPLAARHLFDDPAMAGYDVHAKDATPPELRDKSSDYMSPINAARWSSLKGEFKSAAFLKRLPSAPRGDDPPTGSDAHPWQLPNGLYCDEFGQDCVTNAGHTDPKFPDWSMVHARFHHKPYPPKEQVTHDGGMDTERGAQTPQDITGHSPAYSRAALASDGD